MGQIQQGEGLALGVTVDADGDVVVLVIITDSTQQNFGVTLTTDVALHFGRSIRDLARDAAKLQDELETLDPEEIVDRLGAIQARFNNPAPPV